MCNLKVATFFVIKGLIFCKNDNANIQKTVFGNSLHKGELLKGKRRWQNSLKRKITGRKAGKTVARLSSGKLMSHEPKLMSNTLIPHYDE